jgi:hypothetical protein
MTTTEHRNFYGNDEMKRLKIIQVEKRNVRALRKHLIEDGVS